jgi:hypothetical protein
MASRAAGGAEGEVRALARSVADDLQKRGVSAQDAKTTTEREEQQPTGFLGLRKKTVLVADTKTVARGWLLWSQMLNDALYLSNLSGSSRPVNHVSKELQLWLRDDGEIVAIVFDRDHVILPDRHVEDAEVRVATDDELRYPDFRWNEWEEAGTPNPSVDYKKYWTSDTVGGPLHSVPGGGLESRLRELQRSA